MSRRRGHAAAEPPVNVTLEYADGTIVPVDCTYVGYERRTHVWQVVNPRPQESPIALDVEQMPPHCEIVITGYML